MDVRFRRPPRRHGWWLAAAGGALLVAAGVGLGVSRVRARHNAVSDEGAAQLESVLARWRMSYPELEGTASDHLRTGEATLVADREDSYRESEQSFQEALLLDPKSDDAIAGYALAVAWGRGAQVDAEMLDEALMLVEFAERRGRRSPHLLLAHSQLLLCRPEDHGRVARARELAGEAVQLAPAPLASQANLGLGRAHIVHAAPLALPPLTIALEADPKLHRAYRERARARALLGDFQGALADLNQGLQVEPGHWETLAQLAELRVELGDVSGARALYETAARRAPSQFRPRLALAVLGYQHEAKAGEAVRMLRLVLHDADALEDPVAAEAYSHLAAAERAAALPGAEEAARLALIRVPTFLSAHLQLLLVLLGQEATPEAAAHAAVLQGRLADHGLELLLLGKGQWLNGQVRAAAVSFTGARGLDERRVDAVIWNAVTAARLGQRERALREMERVSEMDPEWSGPLPSNPELFLQEGDTLRGAEGQLVKLQSSDSDVLPRFDEALVLFHQGKFKEAELEVDRVLDTDANHALALSLKALLKLRNPVHAAECREWATQAVRSQRALMLAQYALGRCEAALGHRSEARRALQEAVSRAPGMGSAQVALANLEAPEDARVRLLNLLQRDASFTPAKRALFALTHGRSAMSTQPSSTEHSSGERHP